MIPRLALLALSLAAPPGVARGGADEDAGRTRIAAQLGWADGGLDFGGSAVRLADVLARDPLRLAAALEGSRERWPRVEAGLRLAALLARAGDAGTSTWLLASRLEAAATWRPLPSGPYARLGTGPALLAYRARVPALADGRLVQGGWGIAAAAGATLAATPRLELRLEAEAAAQAWLHAPSGPGFSWALGGAAGLAWR